MKHSLLVSIIAFYLPAWSQTLDFGIEVQQNNNLVKQWLLTDELSDFNRAFSLRDINGDTLNVYFNSFSMTNNFEIPLYFRYNFMNRYFLDFKLSNMAHTLNMEGVSNYNESFFIANYGTYDDFVAQAQADGFTNVDTSDYVNYMNAARAQYVQQVRSKEEFRVLSFTANVGFKLLPHRSLKPYITLGYSVKSKYRKYAYQNLEFSNANIYDYNKVNMGVNKFAETTHYLNLGFGVEFYRFRAGLYYQAGLAFQATNGVTNDVVIEVNPFTPFERIHSYGFTLCANLFSAPIGKRVVYDDFSGEQVVLSNIQRKYYKWDFELRFNRRVFNELSTFYTSPDTRLSVLSRDSVLYNNGSEIQSAEKIEMLTFGDVKRIFWTGQLDFVLKRHFGKRFSLEASLGFSSLTSDIETTEFSATVLHDTSGNAFLYNNAEPRIRSGVYRNTFNLTNFSTSVFFKLVDRDFFSFSVFSGSGFTSMMHRSLAYVDLPDGVNELEIYRTIDQNYYSLDDNGLYAYQGDVALDLNASPDELFNKFGTTKLDSNWPTPQPQRFSFPMVKFGVVATIDRYTLALSMDRSRSYMDGFLLNKYSSVYFSVGYKFWRKER